MKRDEGITLTEVVNVLRWQYPLMFSAAIAGGILAAIVSYLVNPAYEAEILLEVTPSIRIGDRMLAWRSSVQTYMQLAQRKPVLQQVCRKLSIAPKGEIDSTVERLRRDIRIRSFGNTHLFSIAFRSGDPKLARDVANALGDDLVAIGVARKRQKIPDLLAMIDGVIKEFGSKTPTSDSDSSVRDREAREEIYLSLLSTRHEINVDGQSERGEVSIIEPASIPENPVAPKKGANVVLGVMAGLTLGLIVAFRRKRRMDGIDSVGELEVLSGKPVIGLIPKHDMPAGMSWFLRMPNSSDGQDIEKHLEPYRMLAANIEMLPSDKPLGVILMASAVRREGRTTVAASLGYVMAKEEKRVVLVEADMRRPKLGSLWKIQGAGLAGVLSGKVTLEDAVVKVGEPQSNRSFFLLPAGEAQADPDDLLAGDRLKEIIGKLRESYDVVLVDAGPILPASDPSKLAGSVDGILIVAGVGGASRLMLSRGFKEISRMAVPVIGAVLNKAPNAAPNSGHCCRDYFGRADSMAGNSV